MHGKYFDFNLQIILMQIRSSVRQYLMNVKTATTAYDESLNCKPEKLLLMMLILQHLAGQLRDAGTSFRGNATPWKKHSGFETAEPSFRVLRQLRCSLHSLLLYEKKSKEHQTSKQFSFWKPTGANDARH